MVIDIIYTSVGCMADDKNPLSRSLPLHRTRIVDTINNLNNLYVFIIVNTSIYVGESERIENVCWC